MSNKEVRKLNEINKTSNKTKLDRNKPKGCVNEGNKHQGRTIRKIIREGGEVQKNTYKGIQN